ncbi:OmpH family outer membrane protein [Mucilaginibacter sp. UR6-1]|uniref:OmpH family outer membrane protein n=1 Tax=Mucilaginibacter sp. UR6-1 TaxID=1435643 RepID=UPI001E3022EF|nr:OmpH family outer membrane protein [Mucilaginibacter sp. UR6-1]MCC8408880.1 OmpH family outer membrane protein [Mucilaginibacter sp. UR6-1]
MMIHKASYFSKLTLGAASAALLIAGTLAACNNEQKPADKPAASTASTTSTAVAKETIVYINQDTLLSKYEYVKDMGDRLQKKGKAAQGDVDSRKQAVQREFVEYQKNAATMSADQRAATEQRLQKKAQEIQSYEQNATAAFQNTQGDENDKLFNKVSEFTKKYAKEKGYKMILSYSRMNPTVLYGDESLDVTADVVKRLNEEYNKK